jgi:hypothetical protein
MSLYKQQVVDPERESGGRFVRILVVEHLGKRPIQVCAHWDAHNIGTNHGTTEPAIRSVAREDWSRGFLRSKGAAFPQTEFENSPFVFRGFSI